MVVGSSVVDCAIGTSNVNVLPFPGSLSARIVPPWASTTERAIAVLQEARLDDVFARATDAALARAKELAAGE